MRVILVGDGALDVPQSYKAKSRAKILRFARG